MTALGGTAAIQDIIDRKGIEEVVHFTTNYGLTGILASKWLKSRQRLPKDRYLDEVYRPNCDTRKDPAWIDYVNLSITRINDWMFDYSMRLHSHEDRWWVVLAFDPVVLTHPDVIFTTTNNIYSMHIQRNEGPAGLEAMFANPVIGRYGRNHRRHQATPANWTTDRQAEVLYPGQVSTSFLRRIYVSEQEHGDAVEGTLDVTGHSQVVVVHDGDRFL
jgi:ssDNA thymidine ADP-ribosyltransferase, DarT